MNDDGYSFDEEVAVAQSDAVVSLRRIDNHLVVQVLKDRYPEVPIRERFAEASWDDEAVAEGGRVATDGT